MTGNRARSPLMGSWPDDSLVIEMRGQGQLLRENAGALTHTGQKSDPVSNALRENQKRQRSAFNEFTCFNQIEQFFSHQTDTPETQKRLDALSLGFRSNTSRY